MGARRFWVERHSEVRPANEPARPASPRAAFAKVVAATRRLDPSDDFVAVLLANEHNRQSIASLRETCRSLYEEGDQ